MNANKKISELEEKHAVYGVTCKSFAILLKSNNISKQEILDYYDQDKEFLELADLDDIFKDE